MRKQEERSPGEGTRKKTRNYERDAKQKSQLRRVREKENKRMEVWALLPYIIYKLSVASD